MTILDALYLVLVLWGVGYWWPKKETSLSPVVEFLENCIFDLALGSADCLKELESSNQVLNSIKELLYNELLKGTLELKKIYTLREKCIKILFTKKRGLEFLQSFFCKFSVILLVCFFLRIWIKKDSLFESSDIKEDGLFLFLSLSWFLCLCGVLKKINPHSFFSENNKLTKIGELWISQLFSPKVILNPPDELFLRWNQLLDQKIRSGLDLSSSEMIFLEALFEHYLEKDQNHLQKLEEFMFLLEFFGIGGMGTLMLLKPCMMILL